jgi:Ser/Thr protein kinase RdoA (MazF antagonist)
MNLGNEYELISKVLKQFNIAAVKIFPPQKGYRNSSYKIKTENQNLNLIIYKSEKGILQKIKNANNVSNYLYSKGFHTRKTFDPRILKLTGKQTTRFISIYNYLPGETISWEAYTRRHIKELGINLRELHLELKNVQSLWIKDIPKQSDEQLLQINKILKYFLDENIKKALYDKLNIKVNKSILKLFEIVTNKISEKEANQILHMDFVRSNILFKKSHKKVEISGIIDFEKTAKGSVIYDLARTLAFLIVDCKYKKEEEVKKNFLYYGYTHKGEFKIKDYKYLKHLLKFFWTYDFYKFLKHNPYESLEDNEHFVRTRDILVRNKVLILQK